MTNSVTIQQPICGPSKPITNSPNNRPANNQQIAALAPNALTTLQTIKQFLGISSEDHDADGQLTLLINAASAYIESMTGRRFGLETYTQHYQASGQQELVLEQYPIREVYSAKDSRTDTTISSDTYNTDKLGRIGVVWMDEGWPPRYHRGGLAYDPRFNSLYLAVKYLAGYVLPKDVTDDTPVDWILPYDLQLLIWEMIQSKWSDIINGSTGLTAFSISDVSWTFDRSKRDSWTEIINAYKRF
ncbi:hypothetical protein FACS1894184_14650 [Clostridia bacterium]|nr:hypothetical protein FACS1894184_14650 [Clostridia bacterium]